MTGPDDLFEPETVPCPRCDMRFTAGEKIPQHPDRVAAFHGTFKLCPGSGSRIIAHVVVNREESP